MAHIDSGGSDFDVDLESGGTTSEEDGSKDSGSSGEHAKKLLGEVWSELEGLDGTRSVDGLSSYNKLLNSGEISVANMQILSDKLGQETVGFVEKKLGKEKRNKMGSKMPPKPPRPPRGPSLDAADMKLVREISELTMLKRKRMERMKALKKIKAEKASLFNGSNLFAMVITILFCFVIIFQGLLGSRV
uniref:Transmembrane protein n=1 Tax=Davidia involucrata TaxID=16924 RepID=A0A5B7BC21_DAVIN